MPDAPLRLIGLCAAWCGVCREFAPVFAQVAGHHRHLATAWLDVEEPAVSDALGEVEVETFPTVALGRGDTLLFWGEILPKAAVLRRLLDRGAMAAASPDPAHQQAWRQLRHLGG